MNKWKLPVLIIIFVLSLTLLCACYNTSASVGGISNDNTVQDVEDDYIDWDEARSHEGEYITVVGKVVGATYATDSNGKPTFLDIGLDYPDPDRFSVVIWGDSRDNFPGEPESYYLNKTVAVKGEIYLRDGVANMKIDSEDDIEIID